MNYFCVDSFEAGLNSLGNIFAFAEDRKESFESNDYVLEGFIRENRIGLPDSVVFGGLSTEAEDKPGFVARAIAWVKAMLAKFTEWIKSFGKSREALDLKVRHVEDAVEVKNTERDKAKGATRAGKVSSDIVHDGKVAPKDVLAHFASRMDRIKSAANVWSTEVKKKVSDPAPHLIFTDIALKDALTPFVISDAVDHGKTAEYTGTPQEFDNMIEKLVVDGKSLDQYLVKIMDRLGDGVELLERGIKEIEGQLENKGNFTEVEVRSISQKVKYAQEVCSHITGWGTQQIAKYRQWAVGVTLKL